MQTSTCSDSKQSCPANDNHNRFCWLGRMVSLCQYLNDTEIQSRLAATITGIHTVLFVLPNSPFLLSFNIRCEKYK